MLSYCFKFSSDVPVRRLTNKQIILGITGGIAAYKSAELVRQFVKHDAMVRVVMTDAAQEFITPLTMQALSGNPVHTTLLDPAAEAGMGHIELARWADIVMIAPASANFIARLDQGRGDDLLTTLCLATNAPITVAPAMNQAMWLNQHTQDHVKTLSTDGVTIFGPSSGEQACGDVGPGRMLEPEALAQLLAEQFDSRALDGKRLLINAGPTREAIDPIRYISNHSSGKMGFALAEAAAEAGAKVTLITGPVNIATPPRISRVDVITAEDMYQATMEHCAECDIFIASAAVADYSPVAVADQKIKKSQDQFTIEMAPTRDILAEVAQTLPHIFTVGFAAETQNLLTYAETKMLKKGADIIIANDVSVEGIGFNSDDNEVTLVSREGNHTISRASKKQVARQLITKITQIFEQTNMQKHEQNTG